MAVNVTVFVLFLVPVAGLAIVVDALPGKALLGRVAQIVPMMGRKRVRTGDPSEKADRDVQKVLVDLAETDSRLVVGPRVTAKFFGTAEQP